MPASNESAIARNSDICKLKCSKEINRILNPWALYVKPENMSGFFSGFTIALIGFVILLSLPLAHASPISVGQVVVDPPTLENIGLSLPIVSGDTNYNAKVLVSYRKTGDVAWKQGLPMMRVRPETLSTETPTIFPVGNQFAGSIFYLQPDTSYDIMLDIQDTDGGSTTRTLTVRTRPVPPANPANPRTVSVSSLAQLNSAVAAANPGDIILLAAGTYNGGITITRSGTEANPIFIRGQSQDNVIINANTAEAGITISSAYVTVENVTIKGSNSNQWGIILDSTNNAVIRNVKINNVYYGINGRGGTNRDYYVCDNILEGKGAVWPTTDSSVWDYEGIVLTGSGHVVCHNRLSGFGDAVGLSGQTDIPNRADDFYRNDVVWTGDNAIEFDYGERNIRAYENRFTNAGNNPVSFQPLWGGPAYAFRNVIFNSQAGPYKLNNDPTGFYILHNTAVKPGWTWTQYGGEASNFQMFNNIMIGTTNGVEMSTFIQLAQINYNAWRPDGQFRFSSYWNNFAELKQNSPYEKNGILLASMPFANPVPIPASYTVFVQPANVTLSPASPAVDAGLRLPNINDDYTGSAPDLGALEIDRPTPSYGPRPHPVLQPPAPDCTALAGFASLCVNNVPVLTVSNPSLSGSNVNFNVNVNFSSSPVNAIYATGYYFSASQNQWISFTMTGTPYPGTDGSTWLMNTASKSLSVPTSAASNGLIYVVVWEYTYVNNVWTGPSCSNAGGCWRLATISV